MTTTGSARSTPHTRGFLFADLRGYTRFTDDHGDRAAEELIGRYRELVRRQIAAFHGAEIRTEGDSFYVVFDSVSEAVLAGVAIRDAAAEASSDEGDVAINVGIGIHAGETTDGEYGIVSSSVNVAARVCAVARPGEVLVSDTVRALTRTALDLVFVPRGRQRLKGLREPVAVFAVEPGGTRSVTPRPAVRLAAAIGGLALVIAIVATAAALRSATGGGGVRGTPSAEPSGSIAGASSTPQGSVEPTTVAFPDAAERAFLDRLPSGITTRCERADEEEKPDYVVPQFETVVVRDANGQLTRVRRELPELSFPLVTRFGVTCLTTEARITFWAAANAQGGAEELFFNLLTRRSIGEGSCASGGRAYESWATGANSGHLMCLTEGGASVLEWTYAEANVYAIAERRDGDGTALYAWWRDDGRLLGR